jgi:glyoxylase-like metal-dependent hydrolase (beta-lactamase superfamily II)
MDYNIHSIHGYIQTTYLVEYKSGMLLLDAGSRADVNVIADYIKYELRRPMDDLKLIVVTHMHPDHAGGANLLRKRTGAKIAANPMANKWYRGLVGFIRHKVDLLLTWYVAKKLGKPLKNINYSRSLKIDVPLRDGIALPGFSDWTCLFCPGHTDCDMTIYNTQTSMAYVADNIIKSKGKYYRPYPLHKPKEYQLSLKRYLNLKVKTFLLAHGGVMKIDKGDINALIFRTPKTPRKHRNSLFHILGATLKRKKGSSQKEPVKVDVDINVDVDDL